MSDSVIRVGFIGNPNCGKTTLFNAYTGANLKVANWPGVTVEKKEGTTVYKGQEFCLIDLPGIYSLTSYTMEEKEAKALRRLMASAINNNDSSNAKPYNVMAAGKTSTAQTGRFDENGIEYYNGDDEE